LSLFYYPRFLPNSPLLVVFTMLLQPFNPRNLAIVLLREKKFDMDREEASELLTWLSIYQNHFDRQKVNQHLIQYSTGDRKSMLFEQEIV
ncbi:hypothetical protein, partial [Anabaena catenula]|uniref:hypothetical protein n=1 Tax=Anabaena catenula TaxID=1296320 RepID=UPI003BB51A7C